MYDSLAGRISEAGMMIVKRAEIMKNLGNLFEMDNRRSLMLPGGVFIAAGDADLNVLRESFSSEVFRNAALVPLDASAPLPDDLAAQARVLVLEVNPRDPDSVRRLSRVRAARPDLPVIAAIQDSNIALVRTLVREGIADVAVLPFVPDELALQVLDASAKLNDAVGGAKLSPLIAVTRGAGGSGATSVVTHLADALVQADRSRKVCVIDLDVQCGEVVSYLGQTPKVTCAELLDAGDRLDREFLRNALTDSQRGFSVIAAPAAIMPLEHVDVDQVLHLVRLVREEFDYVLVDLPADWTSWSLSVAVGASNVLLVTDLSIAGLRQAKRRIQLLESIGLPAGQLRVVINRAERKLFKPIGVAEVREALGCEVLATLAAEGQAIASAQDQGLLVSEISPKCRFAADIRALERLLTGERS